MKNKVFFSKKKYCYKNKNTLFFKIMKIALVGYGQMGHMIELWSKKLGHEVVATVDTIAPDAKYKVKSGDQDALVQAITQSGAEGIIDFSHPSAVLDNIKALLPTKLPLVVGTTGWNQHEDMVSQWASSTGGTIIRSANFSVGVNLFYRIVQEAAKLFSDFEEYDMAIWEAHHTRKADSPSGTALEIAKRVMCSNPHKTEIVTDAFHDKPNPEQLHVSSTRIGSVPGTHTLFIDSSADTIEITHRARSREGFACGAVRALERLDSALKTGLLQPGKLYSMEDLF